MISSISYLLGGLLWFALYCREKQRREKAERRLEAAKKRLFEFTVATPRSFNLERKAYFFSVQDLGEEADGFNFEVGESFSAVRERAKQ